MTMPSFAVRMPSAESADRAFSDLHAAIMPESPVRGETPVRACSGAHGRISVMENVVSVSTDMPRGAVAALLVWHMAPGTPEGRERLLALLKAAA